VLEAAARHVCAKSRNSRSSQIRLETQKFEARLPTSVRRLQEQLRSGAFQFEKQFVVKLPRPRKPDRLILVASLRDRLVHRAILTVLNGDSGLGLAGVPLVQEVLDFPYSVGGIEGIDKGIALVADELRAGAAYYLNADIKDFFPHLPRDRVRNELLVATKDNALIQLIDAALKVSIANVSDLSKDDLARLPGDSFGVPQGSALSMLFGNLALREFDHLMQGRGIRCIRYVDDFILLGPSEAKARAAFRSAQTYLSGLGLATYEPGDGSGKASAGRTADGIAFLGCQISGSLITPGRAARASLLADVDSALDEARGRIAKALRAGSGRDRGNGATEAMLTVARTVKGWGEAFAFCNGDVVRRQLDRDIADRVDRFQLWVERKISGLDTDQRMRALGVTRLKDLKQKPLVLSDRLLKWSGMPRQAT
jgi:RNA-directed DNA polymerase